MGSKLKRNVWHDELEAEDAENAAMGKLIMAGLVILLILIGFAEYANDGLAQKVAHAEQTMLDEGGTPVVEAITTTVEAVRQ